MIIKTLKKYDFIKEFVTSKERWNQYSYDTLSALYAFIEDSYEGEPYEFDLIEICSSFTEYNTVEEAAEAYSISPVELEDATVVLHVLENGHVVVKNY